MYLKNECVSATKRDGWNIRDAWKATWPIAPLWDWTDRNQNDSWGMFVYSVPKNFDEDFFLSEEVMKISPTHLQAYSGVTLLFVS